MGRKSISHLGEKLSWTIAVYDQTRSPFFRAAATSAKLETNCFGSKTQISATERPVPEPSSRNGGKGIAVNSVSRLAWRAFCAHCLRIGKIFGQSETSSPRWI